MSTSCSIGTPIVAEQTTKSNNFSYKVSLGWEATPDHYLYGFVATGFKPGGLNVPVGFGQPDPFGPEEVTSYEAGWKGNFANGRVRTSVSGFYNRYEDFQVIIGNPTLPIFGLEVNVPGNHQNLRCRKPKSRRGSAASGSTLASAC